MCVAIPGCVVSVSSTDGVSRPGRVRFPDGSVREVDLAMVLQADVGDYVITHSGFAISVMSEELAGQTLDLLGRGQNQSRREEE